MRFLSMAALALVGAVMTGCSSDDDSFAERQQQPADNVVTLTATVGLGNAAEGTTRALADDGTKTFAAGDKIAVIYKDAGGSTVKAESTELTDDDLSTDKKTATFSVTLTNPDKSQNVTYVYPAAMAATDGTVNYAALNTQDGKLATIAANLDCSSGSGAWDGNALPSDVTLENQFAVCALTLENTEGTSNIANGLKQVTVSDGTNTYTVNATGNSGFGTDVIYVAMRPVTTATALTLTATDGTNNYVKTTTNRTYAAGTFSEFSLKMLPSVTDLSMVDCAGNARTTMWTANCYMVHTKGDYKLPLVYGNAIKDGVANEAAYTGVSGTNTTATFPNHAGTAINAPWITKSASGTGVDKGMGITVNSAQLLWEDASGLITKVGISEDGNYLTLTVGNDASKQEGNALIAVKNGNTIVWSWHIWVTKQKFNDLTTINTGNHTYNVTPVNLGWVGNRVSNGKNTFYQWGRKDPFQGTGTLTCASSTTVTIADNIKNPTTFYNVEFKPNNTTYYNLWDALQTGTDNITTATKKTVYDPCPAGFCVPTSNLYHHMGNGLSNRSDTNWDNTNKGKTWTLNSVNLYFPASGLRNLGDGSLSSVGSSGYYWSASSASDNGSSNGRSNGRSLYFNPGSWRWNYYYRANGFPVRAVAEE